MLTNICEEKHSKTRNI